MTPKQKRFVDEYLIDLNATEAALEAEFKDAYSIGNENLKKPEIKKAIHQQMKDREKANRDYSDKVLRVRSYCF